METKRPSAGALLLGLVRWDVFLSGRASLDCPLISRGSWAGSCSVRGASWRPTASRAAAHESGRDCPLNDARDRGVVGDITGYWKSGFRLGLPGALVAAATSRDGRRPRLAAPSARSISSLSAALTRWARGRDGRVERGAARCAASVHSATSRAGTSRFAYVERACGNAKRRTETETAPRLWAAQPGAAVDDDARRFHPRIGDGASGDREGGRWRGEGDCGI